jgi:hypothetical protein
MPCEMINQFEVPMYITEALPEISGDLKVGTTNNAYQQMDILTAFTKKNILEHNYKAVKRSFKLADMLYSKGNMVVKNAIQNVFVYSFTSIFHTCNREKTTVLALLPLSLYTIYITQVCHKGY